MRLETLAKVKWRAVLIGTVFALSFLPAILGVTSPDAVSGWFLVAFVAGSAAILLGTVLDDRAQRRRWRRWAAVGKDR